MTVYSNILHNEDTDLSQRVALFLSGRTQPAIRNLKVQARSGRVLLSGKVRSFYHKQLALELTRRVAGVTQIDDELHVDAAAVVASPATIVDLNRLSPAPSSHLNLI